MYMYQFPFCVCLFIPRGHPRSKSAFFQEQENSQ